MKILRMTATFGKLENATLECKPGLNVFSAPNEWGKTTWCNFMATMLYGLDTREKTTKTSIALKERYAPWSGSPMSGRIDLQWQGKAITIERWSSKRTPLGEFKAYETDSGLTVPELSATNCGEVLLGVEKSVFLRSGFIRLADLPVTADDALRRRLNALVTTGDDSGEADALGQKLKDLKNKCRSNRTNGLIPQAEAEKAELEGKLAQYKQLQTQSEDLRQRHAALTAQLAAWEHHARCLEYAAAEENLQRVQNAQAAAHMAQLRLQALEERCQALPSQEEAQNKLHQLQDLQQLQQQTRIDAQLLPPAPQAPPAPMCFYGLTAAQALAQAEADGGDYAAAQTTEKKTFPFHIPGWICGGIGIALMLLWLWIPAALALMVGIGLLLTHRILRNRQKQRCLEALTRQQTIAARYGGGMPQDWLAQAREYDRQQQAHEAALQQHRQLRHQAQQAMDAADQALSDAVGGMGLSAATAYYTDALRQQNALAEARKASRDATAHAESLAAMTQAMEKPETEDFLTENAIQTQQRIAQCTYQLQQLQQLSGQCQGRMDALGSETALAQALAAVNARLDQLTLYYNALELAQQTLQTATEHLQRRFAPRITQQARELFGQLTGGRYDKLQLNQELTVDAATETDVATRSIQLRSDGTIDQLYLALRLAVAKELTPNAPLILDDALVRFDDTRHAAAMALLRREAEHKQILLFTCQSRET